MPRLSDTTRAQRRQHILTSAFSCFSRDGFHATSMDDVIAATGMSSSAVYRYFRSKEQIIRACAEEGVTRVREIFVALLDRDPCPDPAETLTLLVTELHRRTDNPDYDMTRIALQTWAETLRDPVLHHRTRQLYVDALEHITELAHRWRDNDYLRQKPTPTPSPRSCYRSCTASLSCTTSSTTYLRMRYGPVSPYSGPPPAPRRPPLPPQSRPHRDIYLTDPALGWRGEPSGAENSRAKKRHEFRHSG